MTSTEQNRIEDAWTVASLDHLTTGQAMGDESTGDEWVVERVNVHYPAARVLTTYGVYKMASDAEGNRIDPVDVDDDEVIYRYAVGEQTEFVISGTPEDFWVRVEEAAIEYGDGSYLDYETEEEADRECEAMARRDASMTDVITWDGHQH